MENEETPPFVRIAKALESIAESLYKISNPPMVAKDQVGPGFKALPGEFTIVA